MARGLPEIPEARSNVLCGVQLAGAVSVVQTSVLGSVFDAFVFLLSGGSNTVVGVAASTIGVTQFFSLLPAAFVIDTCDRGSVARWSCLVHLIAFITLAYGFYSYLVPIIIVGLVILAVALELSNSAAEAIFVDSLIPGLRIEWIGTKVTCRYASGALCTAAIFVFFRIAGNRWTVALCRECLVLFIALCCPLIIASLYPMTDPRKYRTRMGVSPFDNQTPASQIAQELHQHPTPSCDTPYHQMTPNTEGTMSGFRESHHNYKAGEAGGVGCSDEETPTTSNTASAFASPSASRRGSRMSSSVSAVYEMLGVALENQTLLQPLCSASGQLDDAAFSLNNNPAGAGVAHLGGVIKGSGGERVRKSSMLDELSRGTPKGRPHLRPHCPSTTSSLSEAPHSPLLTPISMKTPDPFHAKIQDGLVVLPTKAALLSLTSQQLLTPLNAGKKRSPSEEEDARFRRFSSLQRVMPFLVVFSSFVRAWGAGMSMRNFNLFFMNIFHFSPLQVTLVQMGQLMAMASMTKASVYVSRYFGRGVCLFSFNLIGAILFFWLAAAQDHVVFLVLHFLRCGVQNGVSAVNESIIADMTHSCHRGKWMAARSLNSVAWFSSAVVGGVISDKYDYRVTFFTSCFAYSLAAVVLIPLGYDFPRWLDNR